MKIRVQAQGLAELKFGFQDFANLPQGDPEIEMGLIVAWAKSHCPAEPLHRLARTPKNDENVSEVIEGESVNGLLPKGGLKMGNGVRSREFSG